MSNGPSKVARHLGWLAPAAMLVFLTSTAMCARTPAAGAAGSTSAVQAASYSTRGVIKSIDTADKSILIKHEDIPGFMKAMTMLFELKDLEQVKSLAAGDAIQFTFSDEGNGRLLIQTIQKTP